MHPLQVRAGRARVDSAGRDERELTDGKRKLEIYRVAGGKVEFQGKEYDSCSTAAEYARGTVTGKKMNTNGWSFWHYRGEDGKKHRLDEARQRLIRMKGPPGAGGEA